MTYPNDANTYLPGTIQIPSALQIIAATNSNPMEITVSVDSITASNTYIPGQLINLFIPYNYGMWQANGLVAKILEVNGNIFSVLVDSRDFDVFNYVADGMTPATMSPAGSQNLEYSNTTNLIAFQCLNNFGN